MSIFNARRNGGVSDEDLESFLADVQEVIDGPPLVKFESLKKNDWFKNKKEN